MISMSNEQFLRNLFRVGKVTHPTIYPSVDAPAAIVGRRTTYRKGDATIIINTPKPDEQGVSLPRGRYSVRKAKMDLLPPVTIKAGDEQSKGVVSFQSGAFTVRGKVENPTRLAKSSPGPIFSVDDVKSFPMVIIRTQAIMARDGNLFFFDSKSSRPIHECKLSTDEPYRLDGIAIISSFTRAVLRESFYSQVEISPTSPETYLGEGLAYRELGMSFRVEGESGESHTLIQPGALLAVPV